MGYGGVSLGWQANAFGESSVALGMSSYADFHAIGVGDLSRANARYSIAIGEMATVAAGAANNYSVALGASSVVTKGALTSGYTPFLLANGKYNQNYGVLSVGDSGPYGGRIIEHVAPGIDDTDAVTVSQLKAAKTLIDANTAAISTVTTNNKYLSVNTTSSGVASATAGGAVAFGPSAAATNKFTVAIGNDAEASGYSAVALGTGAFAYGDQSTSLGTGAGSMDANTSATSVGYSAMADADSATAIGANSSVTKAHSVALGDGTVASRGGQSYNAYGLLNQVSFGEVAVGSAGNYRQITGVAAGSADYDAVNVMQLRNVVLQATTNLGAVAFSSPTDHSLITLGGAGSAATRISFVAPGIGAGDAANTGQVQSVLNQLNDFKQYVAVQYKDGTQTNVALVGSGGSTISNLKAGVAATDAVNVAQLQAVASQVAAGSPLAALYADTSKDTLSFAGASGTTLKNVSAGIAPTDAVNVSQLQATTTALNAVRDESQATSTSLQSLSATAVVYVDGDKNAIVLGDGSARVRVGNVADGVDAGDAVNRGQLDAVAALAGTGSPLGLVYDDTSRGTLRLAGASGTVVTNVAAGVNPTDAVNVGQLQSVRGDLTAAAGALGGGAMVGLGGFTAPAYTLRGALYHDVGAAFGAVDSTFTQTAAQLASLDARIGAGGGSTPGNDAALATLQGRVEALEKNGGAGTGVAVGGASSAAPSIAAGSNAVAVGGQASAGGANATAIGGSSYAAGPGDTAIGGGATVKADYSTAIGSNAQVAAVATHAVAIGANTQVTQDHAVAIGEGASATAQNSVALGSGSVADRANAVSVGAAGSERAITNVAAGTAATDAATVSQVDAGTQKAIDTAQAYTDKRFVDLQTGLERFQGAISDRFRTVDRRINGTGAMATAMSQMGTASGGASGNGRVAAGVGLQGGERAIAVGYATALGESERVHFNFGGAATSSQRTVGAGVGVDL